LSLCTGINGSIVSFRQPEPPGILSKEESVRLLQATSKSSSAEKSTVESTGNEVIAEPREAAEAVSLVTAGIQVLSS